MAYDLGILFVHGIGQQRRGETLVNFGEPLQDWLQRWLTEDKPDSAPIVTWNDARLRAAEEAPESPPHVTGAWKLAQGTRTVLMAECWWADCFASPSFGELFVWLREAALVTLSLHFGARLRRQVDRFKQSEGRLRKLWEALKVVRELAYFLIGWPLLAVLLLIFLVLMLVVNLIPGAGRLTQRIQFLMAATVGDSYAFLKRPIQCTAVTGQFHRDLRWVSDRSERVAIVAHSQGAAVTHRALRQGLPGKLNENNCRLITFGSGLKKLEELEKIRKEQQFLGYGTLGGLLTMMAAAWVKGWLPFPSLIPDTSFAFVLLFSGALAWMADVFTTARGIQFEPDRFKPEVKFGKAVPWVDLYAFSDPVSNGPLFSPHGGASYMESFEVHNRNSNLSDHTCYWENTEQFISRVALSIAALLGADICPNPDREWLKFASQRRFLRVTALAWSRTLVIFSTLALLVVLWLQERLTPFGEFCFRQFGAQLSAPRWSYVAEKLKDAGDWLDPAVFATLLIAAASFVLFRMVRWLWWLWQDHEIELFFSRKTYEPFNTRAGFFLAGVFGLVACAVAVGTGLLALPGESPRGSVARMLVFMLVPGAVAGLALLASETRRYDYDTGRASGLVGLGFSIAWTLALLRTPLFDRDFNLTTDWAAVPILGIAVGTFFAARWITAGFRNLPRNEP